MHYAAANMTGANRLLVGLAWPLMAVLHWWRSRQCGIALATVNMVEIGFLLLASMYAFVIVLKNSISLLGKFCIKPNWPCLVAYDRSKDNRSHEAS